MTPTPTPKSTWKVGPHTSGPENRRLQKFHLEAQPSCSRNKGGRHASERLNTSGVIVCNCRNASRKRLILPTTHIAQQMQAEWIPPRPSRHEHPTSFRKSFSKTRRAPAWCDRPQRLRKHAGLLTKFFFFSPHLKLSDQNPCRWRISTPRSVQGPYSCLGPVTATRRLREALAGFRRLAGRWQMGAGNGHAGSVSRGSTSNAARDARLPARAARHSSAAMAPVNCSIVRHVPERKRARGDTMCLLCCIMAFRRESRGFWPSEQNKTKQLPLERFDLSDTTD